MSIKHYNMPISQTRPSHNKIKLLYIAASEYDTDWYSTLHTHYCAELFFVIDGKGAFQIEHESYPVSKGDMVVVNPNTLHTEVSLEATPLKYIVLGLEGLRITPANSHDPNINFGITKFFDNYEMLSFYLEQLLNENENKEKGYESICQNLVDILLTLLDRNLHFSTTLATPSTTPRHLCSLVHRYIDTHYKENITLDSLADSIHVSKYHIVHTFTEEYGISPIKYLISKRIQESRELLQTTDYSLAHISRMLGFSSPSYFSQVFKKEENCSPLEYRKNCRQAQNVH